MSICDIQTHVSVNPRVYTIIRQVKWQLTANTHALVNACYYRAKRISTTTHTIQHQPRLFFIVKLICVHKKQALNLYNVLLKYYENEDCTWIVNYSKSILDAFRQLPVPMVAQRI